MEKSLELATKTKLVIILIHVIILPLSEMDLVGIIEFISEEPGRDGFSQIGWCHEWNRETLVPPVGRG